MKVVIIILSLFLLALNLLPCNDVMAKDFCSTELHYHEGDIRDTAGDEDHCSPFCQCVCCDIQIAYSQVIQINSEQLSLSIKRSFLSHNRSKEFSNSLFQPPQV